MLLVGSRLFGQWDANATPTYEELIAFYHKIAKENSEIELYAMGNSDHATPIYLCVINGAQDSLKTFQKAREGNTLLINNAIHAGEPDGVNACLLWIDKWIKEGKKTKGLPLIAIIPAFNVGGMQHRNSTSRANQEGPESYGFRANAQNLDLNRDFVKMDADNAFTFCTIFQALQPVVFLDTHVSNGADYQHTLTYIAPVEQRMSPSMAALTYGNYLPAVIQALQKEKQFIVPYVDLIGDVPEHGIRAFNDLPRYIMGYASLFDAISITLETHMLKPFPERVRATHQFLEETVAWMKKNEQDILKARLEAENYRRDQDIFQFDYELTGKRDSLLFLGYKHSYPISEVTGLPRLKYHRDQPYKKFIPYMHYFAAKDSIVIPRYFIVGAQEKEIIARLKANAIEMRVLQNDTTIPVQTEQITRFESLQKPYEGHFFHSGVTSTFAIKKIQFKKGDVIISTDQRNKMYLMSVLTSRAEDSFFRWNFMDSYLQQKEYFSPYVFEEKAVNILKENPELKNDFETKKKVDPNFSKSSWDQLLFIYQRSEYLEDTYFQLPIFQIK